MNRNTHGNLIKGGALLLLIFILTTPLFGCGKSDAPALGEIYDTVVELIERSYEANELMFGYGLPVYAIDSEEAEEKHLYDDRDYASYEIVTEYSRYAGIGEIRETLESVYSTDYLNSLYPVLFEGYPAGTGFARAQISEKNGELLQSVGYEPLVTERRIYDYSTMKIVKPSSATYVTVEIETHLPHEETTLTVRLGLIFENGEWRLDTPTC